jgi:pyruvate/2-oxoglutarate dehydrogenase complex dihydrolipoamide dehydrogenase (E3) component
MSLRYPACLSAQLIALSTGARTFARMATNAKKFDCVVIGSGQAGTPLATALANSGRKTALIEKSHIGGTCVNVGCTPTKTMIASGRIAHLASRAQDYGVWQRSQKPAYAALRGPKDGEAAPISSAEKLSPVVDMAKVRQRKRDIVDQFRGGSESRLKKVEGLQVIEGEAEFTDPHTLIVKPSHGQDTEVHAETFFINTGERPLRPKLEGLDEILASDIKDAVLDSTSIQELGAVPEKLIVLGGGYIGMEFGQLFRRLGAKVTIVQRGNQLLPREDAEVAKAVLEICKDEGIEVLLDTSADRLRAADHRGESLVLTCTSGDGESKDIEGTHILLATGRTPNSDRLGLDTAGVEMDGRGHIKTSSNLQTSASHIYALGDVHGGPAFTHISYDDYRVIKANFIDKVEQPATITDRQVPYVVYMDPQLGHIGLHESEARKQFPDKTIKTATMPMSYVARALETDETRGLMKAVVDGDSGEILGFTCLGMEGGEIMSIVQVAMLGKLPYTRLRDAVFAHPTLAESLNNLWGFLK